MCDYLLMGIPNRLAVEGEQLVLYKFRTGSKGLASLLDLQPADPPIEQPKTIWARLKSFFNPPERPSVPAVCIPLGARLVMEDIPASLRRNLEVGEIELVTFTQIKAASSTFGLFEGAGIYRDAVRFKHGGEVRLQDLREGQRMWVMSLAGVEAFERVQEAVSRA
jgi:hypothetical protein